MAKISITEPQKRCHTHEHCTCNHSRKHNCDEVSKWPHSAGSFSSYPCQSRYDVGGTGLHIMTHD